MSTILKVTLEQYGETTVEYWSPEAWEGERENCEVCHVLVLSVEKIQACLYDPTPHRLLRHDGGRTLWLDKEGNWTDRPHKARLLSAPRARALRIIFGAQGIETVCSPSRGKKQQFNGTP